MPRLYQAEQATGGKNGTRTVEFASKTRLREDHFDLAMKSSACRQLHNAFVDEVRQLRENANHLLKLGFLQADQLVVQLENGQRFHEHRRAARRGSMNDSLDAALLIRAHGNHEAAVADSDELILKLRRVIGTPQH